VDVSLWRLVGVDKKRGEAMLNMQSVDEMLEAWGRYVRQDYRDLKRVRVAQFNYGEYSPSHFDEQLDVIEWIDSSGMVHCVPLEMAEVACKVVNAIDEKYSNVLRLRFVSCKDAVGSAGQMGVSVRTWHNRLRESKYVFGYVLSRLRGVVQDGVSMRVEGVGDACNDD
jgi:hypothetical protein